MLCTQAQLCQEACPRGRQLFAHDYPHLGASLHHMLICFLQDSALTPCAAFSLSLLGTKILTRDGGAKPGIQKLRKLRQKDGKFQASFSYEIL